MPKLGMEPIRRKALIEAAIVTIGAQGNLEVTMGEIARAAGMSPSLAHHYFHGKDRLLQATMRHLLFKLGVGVANALRGQSEPRVRLSSIVRHNFSGGHFQQETVSAWLAFYLHAQTDEELRGLLRVYHHRLKSNLVYALGGIVARADAQHIAEGIGALIDGLYIRRALMEGPPDAASAIALVEDYIDTKLTILEDLR